jgi:hypothetical protein
MRTLVELPAPLFAVLADSAARKQAPLSRYIAESLEQHLVREPEKPEPPATPDSLFDDLRAELGL